MKRNIEEASANDIDRVSIEQQIIKTPKLEDIESHSTVSVSTNNKDEQIRIKKLLFNAIVNNDIGS
ncbi:MAG: hypothetical protein ACRYE9_02370, partial [Janthinobacterium lividum]